jgi:hypothetical protein
MRVFLLAMAFICLILLIQSRVRREEFSTNVHLITYENANHKHLENLKKSAEMYGWQLDVIGNGDTWIGFGTKTKACIEHLKKLPPNDIAIIIDARDVIVNDSPGVFKEKLRHFQDKVYFSAEARVIEGGYAPPITRENIDFMDAQRKGPLRYLNAGLVFGQVNKLIEVLFAAVKSEIDDDQNSFVHFWNKHPSLISLDYDEHMFSNATFSKNEGGFVHNGYKWVSKTTNSVPVFLQTQGGNWTAYDKLVKNL